MVCQTLNKVETKLILFGGPTLPSESGQPISKHKIYSFLDFGDISIYDISILPASHNIGNQIDLGFNRLRTLMPF